MLLPLPVHDLHDELQLRVLRVVVEAHRLDPGKGGQGVDVGLLSLGRVAHQALEVVEGEAGAGGAPEEEFLHPSEGGPRSRSMASVYAV